MIDLAIIGGGPAGYVAAQRAGAAGLSVALLEQNALGGVCLNEGCIPTKTLLYSAKLYDSAQHADRYGIKIDGASFSYEDIIARKDKVVKKLVAGIKASMKAHNVNVVAAQAQIQGRVTQDSKQVFKIIAGEEEFFASYILICTGSQAILPPIPGLQEAGERVVTSREILLLKERPSELVIIGGGVIGMEFAAYFSTLGSRVTVIEMLPKILGPIDSEVSALLQKIYAKRGVNFCLGCKVSAIEDGEVVYQDAEGQTNRVAADKILISTGRRANLAGFGLETIGVETTRGIVVDNRMRTSVPGVYAAGDVTGFSMLAHTASREGEVAVADILAQIEYTADSIKQDAPTDQSAALRQSTGGTTLCERQAIVPATIMHYNAIPGVVYTQPEVASVGLSEEQASEQDREIIIAKLPMAYSGRFVAENERGEGLCKIIADATSHKVLGVSMIGGPCSEIIHSACIAIEQEMTLEQLREIVFPHPSVSEILKETAFQI